MPHLNMTDANKIQDAMQAAYNLLGGLASPAAGGHRISLLTAIGVLVSAKDQMADPALRDQAFDTYATDDIGIDDEAASSPADNGTWVAAWVWVAGEEVEDDEDPAGEMLG